MADNTQLNTGTGGDIISTDVITTLNGGAIVTGEKAQRTKVGWGVDGTFNDTNAANPLPTSTPDSFFTGTITAADAVVAAPSGNGTPLSGASTAGSIVALASPGGASSWVASITGTISGTYYFEISINSTNGTDGTWINVNGRRTGLVSTTTTADYKTTVSGEFRGSPAAAKYFRVRNVGGSGLNTTVTIGLGTGTGPVFLYSSIPNGSNTIGSVGIDQTTPGTTNMVNVVNARKKFRDGFAIAGTQPIPTIWNTTNTNSSHIITAGGNAAGAAYLRISLNPLVEDSEYTMTSKDTFRFPMRVGFGVSISQRIPGQEVFAGMLGDDGTGNAVDFSTPAVADFSLATATVTVTTNVATVVLSGTTASPYNGGDRISVYGMADSRLNVGPVVVTPLTYNSFTFPVTVANGTYVSTSAFIRFADPLRYAYNGSGYLWENATVTQASIVARRNGTKFRTLNTTQTTTTATQSNVSPYTDAFNSTGNFEQEMRLEEMNYRSFTSDSVASSNNTKYTQDIPDENPDYHIHIRARTLKGFTIPVARITAIAKTGTTTATVTTDVAHGLTTSDFVQIYGVLDSVNFPNLTVQTAVASVVDSTHFTIVIGTATTTSSAGGVVWRVQGSLLAPGVYANNIQSISQTNNVISVVGIATWATPLPGEYMYLYGMTGGAAQTYEGGYKVLRVNTTTVELQGTGATDYTSIATGGAAMRMTDVRIHFTRVMDYSRLVTEVVGGRGSTTDINNSVPVSITGSATLTATVTQSTGNATSPWSAVGYAGLLAADVVSAALTVTTTTAAIVPGLTANFGANSNTYVIAVTAVSGTAPTLDVGIEESPDGGTNWYRIYDFPRITATGIYTSPQIPKKSGNSIRYVQTVTGTTPSFTRSISRDMYSTQAPFWRQFIDRSIVLTTLNSTTPTYFTEGGKDLVLTIKIGASTTAPALQLQGSDDNLAWYNIGSPLTAVASSVVTQMNLDVPTRFTRAIVTNAGVGTTADNVLIKSLGR